MKTGAYVILAILLLAFVSNVAATSAVAQKFGSTAVQPTGPTECITKLMEVGQTAYALYQAFAAEDMTTVIGLLYKIVQDIPLIQAACLN